MQHRGSHVGRPFRVSGFAEASASARVGAADRLRRDKTGDRSSRTAGRRSLRHVLHRTTVAATLAVALATACGKKGPPLPPLVRIPEAVAVTGTRRSGTDAYITLRIPARNIDGSTPVSFAAVEVVALTADRTPSRAMFLERGTPVASVAVVPPPADDRGQPPAAPSGPTPGDQVTVSETLTDEKFVPVAIPATPAEPPRTPAPVPPAAPATAPAPGGAPDSQPPPATAAAAPEIRRYYMAFTRDARNRPGPSATVASLSLASLPDAPTDLRLPYTDQTMTVTWSAVAGATGYNVYADTSASSSPLSGTPLPSVSPPSASPPSASPPSASLPPAPSPSAPSAAVAAPPRPLNGAPVEMTTYSEPVRFGELSCYRVRAVRSAGTEVIEGPASAAACARPSDSFPPAAPEDIRLLPASGAITVEWMANGEADLAGYLVLRGTAGDDTLQPIIDVPIRETQYVDSNVTPGVRYAYAVVAVDTAGNRSAASLREQATAR
jgi:hypothetical protein